MAKKRKRQSKPVIGEPIEIEIQPSPDVKPKFRLVISGGRLTTKIREEETWTELVDVTLFLCQQDGTSIFSGTGFIFNFVAGKGGQPGYWVFTNQSHDRLNDLLVLPEPLDYWTKAALVKWWYGEERIKEMSSDSDHHYLYLYLLGVVETALTAIVLPHGTFGKPSLTRIVDAEGRVLGSFI